MYWMSTCVCGWVRRWENRWVIVWESEWVSEWMLVELCCNYCAASSSNMRKFILPSLPVTEVPSHIYLASLPTRVACPRSINIVRAVRCIPSTRLFLNLLYFLIMSAFLNKFNFVWHWLQSTVVPFHLTDFLRPT